jgi:anti-sigma-K factor RskA
MSHFDPRHQDCEHGLDAGAYVLRALSDAEHERYVAHLAECEDCRFEVARLSQVVDTLPMAAPQLMPPPALKGRIMSVVNAESELLLATGPQLDRVAKPARRWWRPTFDLRSPVTAGLACALLALGVLTGVLASNGPDAPTTRTLAAKATGGATAKLTVTGHKAALEVTQLASLKQGRVYQVWFDRGKGQPEPTHTLFNVRSDGRANVAIEEPIEGVKQILVTPEPSGGSFAPTAAPVITADPV